MMRTPSYDENGRKKGTWTPEEDRKLEAYITKYGYWNWRQLPKYAGLARCGKSCRLRWMNHLRPNVKRGNYTKEEDQIILNLQAQLGNKWSMIASHLPGRSDNEIKNHWHTALKKRAITKIAATNSSDESSKKCNTNKNRGSSITRSSVENKNASDLTNNHLPGRSDNEIKNHWRTALKKRAITKIAATNSSDESSKKCNTNKNSGSNITRSSVENKNASDLTNNMHKNLVLESSEWSPKESSSEEFSSIDCQHDVFEEDLALEEITSGSFWTEPFEVDSKIDFVAPSIDYYGLVCPPSPLIAHEFLSSFDLDDYNW